jgi:hypothetical protein
MKRFLGGFLSILLLTLVFLSACSSLPGPVSEESRMQGALDEASHARQSGPPKDLDTSLTRTSENGLFEAVLTSHLEPVVINEIHSWTLKVKTVEGKAVEGAKISINHLMPDHGHGMPTEPQVTQDQGNGEYLVEGIRFNMRGWWVVDFTIEVGDQSDVVKFNFILQ